MQSSNFGEFPTRLKLVQSFANEVKAQVRANVNPVKYEELYQYLSSRDLYFYLGAPLNSGCCWLTCWRIYIYTTCNSCQSKSILLNPMITVNLFQIGSIRPLTTCASQLSNSSKITWNCRSGRRRIWLITIIVWRNLLRNLTVLLLNLPKTTRYGPIQCLVRSLLIVFLSGNFA